MSIYRTKNKSEEDTILQLYYKDLKGKKSLTYSEEADLAKRIREGDKKAKDELIKANLRFVIKVAQQYENRGLSLKDLISEGNLGLIRAAKKFDGNKNFKFISYAVWWVRQSILQALAESSRFVRIPINKVPVLVEIRKITEKLEQNLGRSPTYSEILENFDFKNSRDLDILLGAEQAPKSIYTEVTHNEGSASLLSLLEDKCAEKPDEIIINKSQKETIEKLLSSVSKRDQKVLKLYFGIDNGCPFTLEEIGSYFNLTRERIRQIKDRALIKLRKYALDSETDKEVVG